MIFFDLETTGLDILNDRIIELYALKINGQEKEELHYLFNPGIPISPESTAIHGYTNEMVKDKPEFKELASNIFTFFYNENLVGYNILNFDILLLTEELSRCNNEFNTEKVKIIDLYTIWIKLEPRTLKGAIKRFCFQDNEKLHSAKNDVIAAQKIMPEMIKIFNLENTSIEELADLSIKEKNSLCYGKILINQEGKKVINFGKHTGKTIDEIYQVDAEYLRWLCKGSNVDSSLKYYVFKEAIKLKKEKDKLKLQNKHE